MKIFIKRQSLFRVSAFLFAILFAGCQSSDEIKQQREEKADKHLEALGKREIAPDKVFTLPECIETALKNNLDIKYSVMKEAVAKERVTAEMLGMLPELNISEVYTARNNEPGASSQSLLTGDQSLVPSKSSQKDEADTKIELVLSTLDFGLAYMNTIQAHDKSLHEAEQKRRTAQNLIVDVVTAYFKVATAQAAVEKTEHLLAVCDKVEEDLSELTKDKIISPLRALDERKKFITQRKRLMEFRRSYENSCVELRSLMGYMPSENIKVNTKCLDRLNIINTPDIDILTRIALKERPELYQLDIQQHITIVEARKTILMMFPNVKMFGDFTNSSNKFLYNQSWWELGVRAAYNMLKLPQQIEQYRTLDKEVDSLDVKNLAMTIGVIAQVRIAHANMVEVKKRYELDQRIFESYNEHLDFAKSNAGILGKISPVELARLELETAETSIERTQALSNYYLSYYRLLNMIGVESIDQADIESVVSKLAERAKKEVEEEKTQTIQPLTDAELEALKTSMDIGAPKKKKDAVEKTSTMAQPDKAIPYNYTTKSLTAINKEDKYGYQGR